jgi:hypothetical protein
MNAQAEAIFRDARAAHKTTADAVSLEPPDYHALMLFHTQQMEQLAAPAKVVTILKNAGLTNTTAREKFDSLPAGAQSILRSCEQAGLGRFIPRDDDT